jgi:hypothetical protein
MNKPNKSIIAMRKAGLTVSSAFTEEQKINAQKVVESAYKEHFRILILEIFEDIEFIPESSEEFKDVLTEAVIKTLKADRLAQKSYKLGLKGIRIGQEASHGH